MKYVLFYTSAPDVATTAPAHFPGHAARSAELRARGLLLVTGPFADARTDVAMAIFTTEDAAIESATRDPFVLNGVVASGSVRGWRESLVPEAATHTAP